MRTRHTLLGAAVLIGFALAGSTGAAAQGVPLFAVLNGGNECGASAPLAAAPCKIGDIPRAYGSATVIFPTATSICFGIVVADMVSPPTAAHIHKGTSGNNGPVVIPLVPVPAGGAPGAASGCFALPVGVAGPIRSNPTGHYINVHSATFQGGAIRGQLF